MTDTVNKQDDIVRGALGWTLATLIQVVAGTPVKNLDEVIAHAEAVLSTPSTPSTPVQGYREAPEIELALLQMWARHGFDEIYKYKNRVKAYRESLSNIELFTDLTCGRYFSDVEDIASNHNNPEEGKVSVAELIRKRQAISQTDIQPSGWIPLSTQPKEREWYLITDGGAVGYGRWHGNGWNIENSPVLYDVTHWMPLPPPPVINSTEDDQPGPRRTTDDDA